jgi:hypothetical protein
MVRSELSEWSDESLAASLPELPWQKRERYIAAGLKEADAELIRADMRDAQFFDAVLAELENDAEPVRTELVSLAVNYFVSDLKGLAAKGGDGSDSCFGNVTPNHSLSSYAWRMLAIFLHAVRRIRSQSFLQKAASACCRRARRAAPGERYRSA